MNYQTLFKCSEDKSIKVALVGAGEFGASFLFQAERTPHLEVAAVCTRTTRKAVDGYIEAGVPADQVAVCASSEEAVKALADGKRVVTADIDVVMGLPLDVLVESSGNPEAGAVAADLALRYGMHVIMVSKEVDSVIGPVLCDKARKAGLVYTTGEGDQPSLLIGLITWARALGLEIVAAGKSSEYDFVFDPAKDEVVCHGETYAAPGMRELWEAGERTAAQMAAARHTLLAAIPHCSIPDMCEMCVVANATGILPDAPVFSAPVARIVELPDMLGTEAEGGVQRSRGTINTFNCLRRPDEASMAGGVFVVVACHDKKSWQVLEDKGHPVSRDKGRALLYHPAHLLGVESGTSVLAAALMGQATGGEVLYPHCDLIGRAEKDLRAGTVLDMGGHHHIIDGVGGEVVPATRMAAEAPVPFYMLAGAELMQDVPAGAVITYAHVTTPSVSKLWSLRREQESIFVK